MTAQHLYVVSTGGTEVEDFGPFLSLTEARSFAGTVGGTVHEVGAVRLHLSAGREPRVVFQGESMSWTRTLPAFPDPDAA
jgi:hypothetical protein